MSAMSASPCPTASREQPHPRIRRAGVFGSTARLTDTDVPCSSGFGNARESAPKGDRNMTSRIIVAIVAVLSLAFLGGCGGDNPTPAGPSGGGGSTPTPAQSDVRGTYTGAWHLLQPERRNGDATVTLETPTMGRSQSATVRTVSHNFAGSTAADETHRGTLECPQGSAQCRFTSETNVSGRRREVSATFTKGTTPTATVAQTEYQGGRVALSMEFRDLRRSGGSRGGGSTPTAPAQPVSLAGEYCGRGSLQAFDFGDGRLFSTSTEERSVTLPREPRNGESLTMNVSGSGYELHTTATWRCSSTQCEWGGTSPSTDGRNIGSIREIARLTVYRNPPRMDVYSELQYHETRRGRSDFWKWVTWEATGLPPCDGRSGGGGGGGGTGGGGGGGDGGGGGGTTSGVFPAAGTYHDSGAYYVDSNGFETGERLRSFTVTVPENVARVGTSMFLRWRGERSDGRTFEGGGTATWDECQRSDLATAQWCVWRGTDSIGRRFYLFLTRSGNSGPVREGDFITSQGAGANELRADDLRPR